MNTENYRALLAYAAEAEADAEHWIARLDGCDPIAAHRLRQVSNLLNRIFADAGRRAGEVGDAH